MKTNIFEPENKLIKLKNIDIIRDNNYTNFSYVEGSLNSEISFYFKGSEIEIISDLCWNRSNNILVQIDDKEYRFNQQSTDIKSNKMYYKRTLIDITDIEEGIHFIKICLDEKSTRGKDKKFRFTIDTIRCNGELVDGENNYELRNVKVIEKDLFKAYLNGNEDNNEEEIVFTDDGNIYLVQGKNTVLCNSGSSGGETDFKIDRLPEF